MSGDNPYYLENQMRLYFKVAFICFVIFLALSGLVSYGWYKMTPEQRAEIKTQLDKAFAKRNNNFWGGGYDENDGYNNQYQEQPSYSPEGQLPPTGAEDRPQLDNNCVVNGGCG